MSKPKVYMTFAGAVGDNVTASRTLLRIDINDKTYYGLIDYGIFQGENDERNCDYLIDGSNLDFVIVTHSHADHILGLPLLKDYEGKIYGTAETFALGLNHMYDAAYIYEKNAADFYGMDINVYRQIIYESVKIDEREKLRRMEEYNEFKEQIEEIQSYALYTKKDVDNIAMHFCSVAPYTDIPIADGIYARLIPTPHINGAVSVELYIGDYGEDSVNIAFSGDIGSSTDILYKSHPYKSNQLINYYVMEGLHGVEEQEQTQEEAFHKFRNIIMKGLKGGYKIIIGALSNSRTSLAIYALNKMIDNYGLEAPIYLDTNLGEKDHRYYMASYSKTNSFWFNDLGKNPFDMNEIITLRKRDEHLRVVRSYSPMIIITASAMGNGGRIVDYFSHDIQNEKAIFIFLSWLKPDTPSYILHNADLKNHEIIEINGENFAKFCKTYNIIGFSGHGYWQDYFATIDRYPCCKTIFLNHGEREAKYALKEKIQENYEVDVKIPEMTEEGEIQSFYSITAESLEEMKIPEGFDIFSKVLHINTFTE